VVPRGDAVAARPRDHLHRVEKVAQRLLTTGLNQTDRICRIWPAILLRVRQLEAAVVAGVRAERARSEITRTPLSRRVAFLSGIMLVIWGNGLVLVSRAAGDDYREVVTLAGQVVAITLAVGLSLGAGGFSAAELGLRPARLRGLAFKALTVLVAIVGLAVLAIASRGDDCDADGGIGINVGRQLLATALGEEVLFRGVLFAVWSRTRATDRVVVLANVVCFALWHVAGGFNDGTFNAMSVIGPAVGALWFLWTRCRFSSVVAAAVPHATTNVPTWFVANCI
jgi:membrane protease YdiL (CAAX protease family)